MSWALTVNALLAARTHFSSGQDACYLLKARVSDTALKHAGYLRGTTGVLQGCTLRALRLRGARSVQTVVATSLRAPYL
jgi:hypothetical protein